MDGQLLPAGGTDAADARDDQVDEGGMIVVAASLAVIPSPLPQNGAGQPNTRIGMHILVQIGRTVLVAVGVGVLKQQLRKICGGDGGILGGVEVFDDRRQGLGGGEGPYRAIPQALVVEGLAAKEKQRKKL